MRKGWREENLDLREREREREAEGELHTEEIRNLYSSPNIVLGSSNTG
jgi:hypothetical protein